MVEPYIESKGGKKQKKWKVLMAINQLTFFNKPELDKLIDSLQWKKEIIGLIVGEQSILLLQSPNQSLNQFSEPDNTGGSILPSFLGNGVYSIENLYSRIFEDATADYLNDLLNHNFIIDKRAKPSYLNGKEIDVIARQVSGIKQVIVCECKFRIVSDKPISLDEIEEFREKIELIRKNETEESALTKFRFWVVTNTTAEENAVKLAKAHNVMIMKASITRNWQRNHQWKITTMEFV